MKNSNRSGMRIGLLVLSLLLGSVAALASIIDDTLTGKYEGAVKGPDEKISLDLKSEGGKISGRLTRGAVTMDVTEGSLKDGTLSLTLGKDGSIMARVQGEKLVGDWLAGDQKRAIELTRVMSTAAAGPVNLNGSWDAVADANGQAFPFTLTMKIDGETVTGNSSSQLGDSTISSGTWKDGKLVITLEGPNAVVTLSAVVVEGKLSGEFDFSGQLQGRWVAVKKN